MKEHKEFRVLHACADGSIQDNGGHNGTFNQLRALFTPDHGWLVADPDNLPADFSIDTYTIADGQLVKASAELLAERLTVKAKAAAVVEIQELQTYLVSTDYAAIKCGELGLAMADTYPDLHAQRTAARARINELQEGGAE